MYKRQDYDGLRDAALCRAKADWLVGINATRLFSVLYHRTLNIGRVMSPTLALIVQREAEIDTFKPVPFYTVTLELPGFTVSGERMADKAAAQQLKTACQGAAATVKKVGRKNKSEKPPALYDLTTLQRDANRLLGFTAQQTLDYLRKEKKARLDRGAERELQDLKRQMTVLEAEEDGYSQLLEDIRQQQEMLEQVRSQRQSAKVSGRESRKREQQERMEAIRLIEENNYVADQYQRKKAVYEQLKQQAAEADFDAMKEEWDAANEEYDALSDDYSQLMGRNLAILFSVCLLYTSPSPRD